MRIQLNDSVAAPIKHQQSYARVLSETIRDALSHPSTWMVAAVLFFLRRDAIAAAAKQVEAATVLEHDKFLYPLR